MCIHTEDRKVIIKAPLRWNKTGSMAVEVSILLPLLIIGILSVAYIININSLTENVMSISADESRRVAINSYSKIGKGYSLMFPMEVEKRLKEENPQCSNMDVRDFKYLYSKKGMDNLISFNVDYSVMPKLGLNMTGEIHLQETITTRAFVGKDRYEASKGYEEMSKDEDAYMVWIFPVNGSKYHDKGCRYLKAAASRNSLTRDIKRKFKPCKLCDAERIGEGQAVYCFFNSGEVYHRKSCKTVDKYVIEVEKQVALDKGYAPCAVCGGGC